MLNLERARECPVASDVAVIHRSFSTEGFIGNKPGAIMSVMPLSGKLSIEKKESYGIGFYFHDSSPYYLMYFTDLLHREYALSRIRLLHSGENYVITPEFFMHYRDVAETFDRYRGYKFSDLIQYTCSKTNTLYSEIVQKFNDKVNDEYITPLTEAEMIALQKDDIPASWLMLDTPEIWERIALFMMTLTFSKKITNPFLVMNVIAKTHYSSLNL